MNIDVKQLRKQIGRFLAERRMQMGHSAEELGQFIGVTANTIKGIETGRFALDIDLLLKLCGALEIKPFFAPLELIGSGTLSSLPVTDQLFLMAPDHVNNELYLLHRGHPACLIQVVMTTPTTFRIVDNYSNLSAEELALHPFIEEAEKFFKSYVESTDQN